MHGPDRTPHFRVIEGGLAFDSAGTIPAPINVQPEALNAALRARVRRAEKETRAIAGLMAPAIAVIGKSENEIAQMIAASGWSDATATRTIFRRAARNAHELGDLLQAAEAKLAEIITAMLSQALSEENTNGQDD